MRFSYGTKGTARYQLNSLAAKSHQAIQTVEYGCSSAQPAVKLTGWNGVEFPVRESSSDVMSSIDVKLSCKVGAPPQLVALP